MAVRATVTLFAASQSKYAAIPHHNGHPTPSAVSPRAVFLPDSICPKGWELPRINNDKSYRNLLVDVYGQKTGSGTDHNGSKGVQFIPLSFLRFGRYGYNGNREFRGGNGFYLESRALSNINVASLGFGINDIGFQNPYSKGYGHSVRCVSK